MAILMETSILPILECIIVEKNLGANANNNIAARIVKKYTIPTTLKILAHFPVIRMRLPAMLVTKAFRLYDRARSYKRKSTVIFPTNTAVHHVLITVVTLSRLIAIIKNSIVERILLCAISGIKTSSQFLWSVYSRQTS